MKHNHHRHRLFRSNWLIAVVAVLFLLAFVVGCNDDDTTGGTTAPVVVEPLPDPDLGDPVGIESVENILKGLENIQNSIDEIHKRISVDNLPTVPDEANQILNVALSADTVLEGGSVDLSLSRSELEADEGEMEVTVRLPEGLKFAGEMRQAHIVFETGATHKDLTLNTDLIADPTLHQRTITIDGSHISPGIDPMPESVELTVANYNVITARLSTSSVASGQRVTVYIEASRPVQSDLIVSLDAMDMFTTNSPLIALCYGERTASNKFIVRPVDRATNVAITLQRRTTLPPVYKLASEPLELEVTRSSGIVNQQDRTDEDNRVGCGSPGRTVRRNNPSPPPARIVPLPIMEEPEPAPILRNPGDDTVEGIDADNDLIRDDVEFAISVIYEDSEPNRDVLLLFAQSLQKALISSETSTDIDNAEAADDYLLAIGCLSVLTNLDTLDLAVVEVLVINTLERIIANDEWEQSLHGVSFEVRSPTEEECLSAIEAGGI